MSKFDSQINYNDKVIIINSTDKGLSKSRNLLLEYCGTDWLWIQDDDIELDVSKVENFRTVLLNLSSDIALIKVGSSENKSMFYKDYSFHKKHSYTNMLRISSIEILVKTSFIKEKSIRFNEDYGLGTSLPCCEENLFLISCFNNAARFSYLDYVLCYHTTLEESRNIDYSKRLLARGSFLNFIPLKLRLLLFFSWVVRGKEFNFFIRMKNIFVGYFYY
ncbi:glycosyltransferase [Vibrio diabolicus]|uniref:glycosyltransferase n=1 Tax=Vibrio diabolicus TaxID=50719 RepID=UPI00375255BF